MKLDKAIAILSESTYSGMTTFDEKYKQAQRLGIEAMKRFVHYRRDTVNSILDPLPGETKE